MYYTTCPHCGAHLDPCLLYTSFKMVDHIHITDTLGCHSSSVCPIQLGKSLVVTAVQDILFQFRTRISNSECRVDVSWESDCTR